MPFVFHYTDVNYLDLCKALNKPPLMALPATLPGYSLTYRGYSRKRGSSLATLQRFKGRAVHGSITLVTADDATIVDRLYLPYAKTTVKVTIPLTKDVVVCNTYVMEDSAAKLQPSDDYLGKILKHLKGYWSGELGVKDIYNPALESPMEEPLSSPIPSQEQVEVSQVSQVTQVSQETCADVVIRDMEDIRSALDLPAKNETIQVVESKAKEKKKKRGRPRKS